MELCKVSVVVPAYNVGPYIAETLDSLMRQTLSGVEVIVVNDGSTDGTQAIIDKYCAENKNIRCFFQSNAGVSAARNFGLTQAGGRYVLFLDSDDLLTDTSLEAFYAALEKTGADAAIGRLQSFGSGAVKNNGYAESLAQKKEIGLFDRDLLWNFLVGNKCYRTEALLRSGVTFPGLKYSEEGVFFFEFIMRSEAKMTGVPGACMLYRRRDARGDASVTQTVSKALTLDFIESMSRIYAAADEALEREAVPAAERAAYLDEVIFKADNTVVTQFYRLLWQADEETLHLIRRAHERLNTRLTEPEQKRLGAMHTDIHEMYFDKREIAEKPKISVVIQGLTGDALARTLNAVYLQTMPYFEVLIGSQGSGVRDQDIPDRWRGCENLRLLPERGFKKAAKAKKVLIIKKERALDERLFRYLLRMPVPEPLKTIFFRPLAALTQAAISFLNK